MATMDIITNFHFPKKSKVTKTLFDSPIPPSGAFIVLDDINYNVGEVHIHYGVDVCIANVELICIEG